MNDLIDTIKNLVEQGQERFRVYVEYNLKLGSYILVTNL